ncbi:hypothetical protein K2173_012694 [Erythroxylum novogranatense]|uniref:Protein TIFY n=1 Tax=Erythroxylum novogranatense TaxID=1862640 RepID=A0AAV8TTL5_9ROSI|nr:hypothetical protein K2173_012694 [Erythroxylum novogranatense]
MERDFLGLSSKQPLVPAEDEVNVDGFKETGSGLRWPFSNKISAVTHSKSFKVPQEDKTQKIASDLLLPLNFLSISPADGYDPSGKRPIAEIRKSFNQDRQGGTHFSLTAYAQQHDVLSVHHPLDGKMFPVSSHAVSVAVDNPLSRSYFATTEQTISGTNRKPLLLGGIPVMASNFPTFSSAVGKTEACVKTPVSPTPLTIFYAGTVNVYDDITPEKARSIMFLAETGSSNSSNTAQPKVEVQAPILNQTAAGVNPVNQPISTPPCSHFSSPLSVSSHSVAQSVSGSTSTEEIIATKSTGVSNTVSKLETKNISSAMGSLGATATIPSVPQARKASLARFLEKRKERIMSAAPYDPSKKSPARTASKAAE